MKTFWLVALGCSLGLAVLAQTGCSACTGDNCNNGVGGGSGGGGSGGSGGGIDLYDRYTLDTAVSDRFYMDLVVDKTRNRVGIAYFVGKGEIPIIYLEGDAGISAGDGGQLDAGTYELKYVEWEDGMTRAPQRVDTVSRMVGLAIDFHPTTGEPAIGYLGGGSDMSLYWFNSDAQLATRAGGVTWMNSSAATNGFQVMCNNPVSDVAAGIVVGLWPAIKYDSTGQLWYCYRDVHTGQYPQGDWAGSDVECVRGGPGNWTRQCTYAGGNTKNAPGGRIRMTMVDDKPVIVWDQVFGGGDTSGQNVWMQTWNGTVWSALAGVFTMANTQNGASVDYDSMEGIGVAAVDQTQGTLFYASRKTGSNMFSNPDPVFGEGTGGWFPSLAMDTVNHEPAIAYYVCSTRSGQNFSQCQPDFDEIRVTQRINNDWAGHTERVDTVSATMVKLAFLPNGRKVIAYRERNGTLKIAVRKSAN